MSDSADWTRSEAKSTHDRSAPRPSGGRFPLTEALSDAIPFLLTNRLTAWHDLFQTPTGGALILRAVWVSAAFSLPPLVAAWVIFNRRDVAV